MSEDLRILLVEDDPDDATLIEHQLRSDKIRFVSRRVVDKAELLAQLKHASWDIILADYSLPQLNAFEVLELLRREQRDIPLILITGMLSEELAVSFIKQGGEDFILKSSLKRLPLAVVGALEKKKAEREQQKAQAALINSQHQLRALAARMEAARESESRRIAREIHDELGQVLTGLKIGLSRVAAALLAKNEPLAEKLIAMEDTVSESIRTLRRIATELRPRMLDDLGLAAALRWQARQYQARTGIRCDFRLKTKDRIYSGELATAVFRIVQEALTNVARHAQATKVVIELAEREGTLRLEVRDNGVGIENRGIRDVNSLGLLGMEERALLLGGTFEIRRAPRHGTVLVVCIPTNPQPG